MDALVITWPCKYAVQPAQSPISQRDLHRIKIERGEHFSRGQGSDVAHPAIDITISHTCTST
eukprot:1170972-Amphidinium_carterae.1